MTDAPISAASVERFTWTREKLAEALRLWNEEKLPASAIARRIGAGCTKGMVIGMAHRHGGEKRRSPLADPALSSWRL